MKDKDVDRWWVYYVLDDALIVERSTNGRAAADQRVGELEFAGKEAFRTTFFIKGALS